MKTTITKLALTFGLIFTIPTALAKESAVSTPESLSQDWKYKGIIVNEPDWDLWGASPVIDENDKTNLFIARWPTKVGFNKGWKVDCEIARYIADKPTGPFKYVETIIKPDPKSERWDKLGLHNPNIQRLKDGRYVLTYIGRPSTKGMAGNQRIGMLVADKITGPWKRTNGVNKPILDVPSDPSIWCYEPQNGVCNPALLEMPDGKYNLYFKSHDGKRTVMGVAIADKLEGPYVMEKTPITENKFNIEDGYAFHWGNKVCFVTTDNHGIIENGGGLLWQSNDGTTFDQTPLAAFPRFDKAYLQGVDRSKFKTRYTGNVKFERPQILVIDSAPKYLYVPCGVATDGSNGTNVYLLESKPDTNK